MHDPKEELFQDVQKILQYLKSTPGKGILFKKGEGLTIKGYIEADYVGSLIDRRSTIGYFTYVAGNVIIWRCKKQQL